MAVAISNTASLIGTDAVGGNVTYTAASIGTADSNRIVVVGATCEDSQDIPTTATIDYGAGAVTMLATANAQQGAVSSRIFYAWAPTGTTANIVIGFAGGTVAAQASAIVVYRVVGARVHIVGAGMASTDMDSNSPLTTSAITTLASGGLILSAGGASVATTFTWSANVTESVTDAVTTNYTYGAAHTTTAITATAVTCTGNVNGQDGALAWIAFGPGANTNAAFTAAGTLAITGPFARCKCSAALVGTGNFFGDGAIQGLAPLVGEATFAGIGTLSASATIAGLSTTIFQVTPVHTNNADTGLSYREVVPITSGGLGQIRVTFIASSNIATDGSFQTDHCSIGVSNGTTWQTTATPVELLFSGSHGFNLTTNSQQITSDWADLTGFTSSNKLVVVIDRNPTTDGGGSGAFEPVTGASFYFKAATASYNASAPTGFSLQSASSCGIIKIEVQSSGVPALQGTGAFVGAGQLAPSITQFTAGKYDESGEVASLSLSADAFTELEFGLAIDVNNVKTGDTLAFRVYVNGSPLDIYSVTPTGTVAAHTIPATALFAGVGTAVSTAKLTMSARAAYAGVGVLADTTAKMILRPTAAFQGVGTLSSTPILNMRGFATFAGVGALLATKPTLVKFVTLAFSASGSQSATVKLLMASTAAFAGTGTLPDVTAKLILRPTAAFIGAGTFLADASIAVAAMTGSAAFIGTGSLVPSTTHFSAGKYDESGEVTSTIAADAYSELEFGLKLDLDNNVQTGDILSFRVYSDGLPLDNYAITPSITIAAHLMQSTAAFVGVGTLIADATIVTGAITAWDGAAAFIGAGTMATTVTMLLRPIATFAGVGSFAANNPRLVLPDTATYQGVGTVVATPRLFMAAQSALTGVGTLLATTSAMRLPTNATFAGVGTITADAIIAGVQQITAIFAGVGNLSTTATLRMVAATTALQGVGTLSATPQEQMAAQTVLIGAGNFAANVTRRINLTAEALAGVSNLTATATEILRPIATFSGVGTFIASGPSLFVLSSAAFQGSGLFTAIPTLRMAASEVLAGAGSLSVTPQLTMATQVTFAGAGTLISNLARTITLTAETFAGVGTLAVTPNIVLTSNAAYQGSGLMSSTAIEILRPVAAFSGVGTLFVDLFKLGAQAISAAYAGAGTLTMAPQLRMVASATFFAGDGSLSVTPALRMQASEAMVAAGTLAASAPVMWAPMSAIFAGAGSLAANRPTLTMLSNELLSGVGTLLADLTLAGAANVWQGSALYAGVGTLTALNLKQWMASSLLYTGDSTFSITPRLRMRVTEAMTGSGTLDASAAFMLLRPRATFAGAGALVSSAGIFRPMFATYAGAGTMVSTAKMLWGPIATYAGASSFAITPRLRMAANAVYTGDSTFVSTPILRMRAATTAFTGAGLMSVNMLQFGKGILIEALLAGASTLTAIANMQIVSAAQFAAEGSMTADIIKFVGLELFASGTGSLIVDMQLAMAAQQMYSGTGYLNVRFSQISLHGAAADRVVLSDVELRAATADPGLREIITDDELRGVIADVETRTTEATQ